MALGGSESALHGRSGHPTGPGFESSLPAGSLRAPGEDERPSLVNSQRLPGGGNTSPRHKMYSHDMPTLFPKCPEFWPRQACALPLRTHPPGWARRHHSSHWGSDQSGPSDAGPRLTPRNGGPDSTPGSWSCGTARQAGRSTTLCGPAPRGREPLASRASHKCTISTVRTPARWSHRPHRARHTATPGGAPLQRLQRKDGGSSCHPSPISPKSRAPAAARAESRTWWAPCGETAPRPGPMYPTCPPASRRYRPRRPPRWPQSCSPECTKAATNPRRAGETCHTQALAVHRWVASGIHPEGSQRGPISSFMKTWAKKPSFRRAEPASTQRVR